MDVSIIIINFNTKLLTDACINSIFEKTFDVSFEIILVDNGSRDGSIELFGSRNDIVLIKSDTNLGFGAANNLGASSAKGKFLFCLNSDTILFENSVKILFDFFKENKERLKIGSLGCVLVDENLQVTHSSNDLPTAPKVLKTLFLYNFFANYGKKIQELEFKQYTDCISEVGYVTGADLMMEKVVFEEIGGFDKMFFMYYEDSYLHYTLKLKKDLKSYIINKTKIIHLEGKSSNEVSLDKLKMIELSLFKYMSATNSRASAKFFKIIYTFLRFRIIFKPRKTLKDKLNYLAFLFKNV